MFQNVLNKIPPPFCLRPLTKAPLNNVEILNGAMVVRQRRLIIPEIEREPLWVTIIHVDHHLFFGVPDALRNLLEGD
jgi:hypothetical protein